MNFKIKNSRPLFAIIFKSKMVISRLEILERVLAGVSITYVPKRWPSFQCQVVANDVSRPLNIPFHGLQKQRPHLNDKHFFTEIMLCHSLSVHLFNIH